MQAPGSNTIVVGVDGSNASVRALVWAVREAVQGGQDVEVLTVWPAQGAVMVHEVPGHYSEPRGHAVAAQRRAVAQAQTEVARLPRITERVENSRPLEALLAASATSHLLVVGSTHARRHEFGGASDRLVDRCYDDALSSVAVVEESGSVHRRPHRAQA